MLEWDADIDQRNDYGVTPLMMALRNGFEIVARMLLERHSSLESSDSDEFTALHEASSRGFGDLVRLVLKWFTHIDAITKGLVTPLMCAISERRVSVVRILLD